MFEIIVVWTPVVVLHERKYGIITAAIFTTDYCNVQHWLMTSFQLNLDIFIDADLTMRTHVQRTVGCFAIFGNSAASDDQFHHLCLEEQSLDLLLFLRWTIGNVVAGLCCLPTRILNRLQSVLNAAVVWRSEYHIHCCEQLNESSLNWLSSTELIAALRSASTRRLSLSSCLPPKTLWF